MRLHQIAVYPMKSGAAERPLEARVTRIGLEGDRELMVVDEHGFFVTQREHPELALVVARVVGDRVRLSLPSGEAAEASLRRENDLREVVVWRSRCRAFDLGEEMAVLLSRYLGRKVGLVRLDPGFERRVNPKYGREDDSVSFADGYPLLVVNLASLADLNTRLPEPVSIDRFRPNLVIEGAEPFEEDHWASIEIGEVELEVVKPCDRCVVVNTDQATGRRSPEVLKTLGAYRVRPLGVIFGQNLIPRRLGVVRVGDEVRPRKPTGSATP